MREKSSYRRHTKYFGRYLKKLHPLGKPFSNFINFTPSSFFWSFLKRSDVLSTTHAYACMLYVHRRNELAWENFQSFLSEFLQLIELYTVGKIVTLCISKELGISFKKERKLLKGSASFSKNEVLRIILPTRNNSLSLIFWLRNLRKCSNCMRPEISPNFLFFSTL